MGCGSLTSVVIPNSVASIGDYSFYLCTGLTSVVIPSSVTNIAEGAYSQCTSLTQVTIAGSVVSIGDSAFQNCSNLTSVVMRNGTASIGRGSFQACVNLASFVIPNSVISLGSSAFESCTNLACVTIGDGVTSIGDNAFYYCTSLTNVTIPNSVTSIGASAFHTCANLSAAYFRANAPIDFGNQFLYDPNAVVYYLTGTTGWGSTFGGAPAVLWNPQALSPGVTSGWFGFGITGPANVPIVVEACASLSVPVWLPVSTNVLNAAGTSVFKDPQSSGFPNRFYRFRSP